MRSLIIGDESSGADLVAELRSLGAEFEVYRPERPYAVDRRGEVPPVPKDLVDLCLRYRPEFIVPGAEHWVALADIAAARYTANPNAPDRVFARRNKTGMAATLREAGIRHPHTLEVRSADGLARMLETLNYPVVVKPSASGGSDMCSICPDALAAEAAVSKVLGTTNLLGQQNSGVTVQEYLDGPQLFVNTVSAHGEHTVTEVFKYVLDEDDGIPTIRAAYTLSAADPDAVAAVDYVLDCLDALGFGFGASHTEVRMTTTGPNFVEFNGRMMGPCIPGEIYRGVRGYSQASELARLLHTGATACEKSGPRWSESLLGWYMLSADRPGRLVGLDYSTVLALPGVLAVERRPEPGIDVTTDNRVTTGSMGMVFFTADSERRALETVAALREIECAGGIFTLAELC
ncbi:ATP-grasp domain-containing protein [Nocardia sp. CDC159]|uniref:ATP-grasp domain-containing protein n=1 Tax=Nocardia pulmonis TaxID=2951408 RepID=A0A9X2IVW7_9NOCA|nr:MULTISPECIES: ATP-grasp domain-containing protein [Nocardia]MCM6774322.1 ATP-grasp domain-containing protein [Nocardia pulmonis]MCM6787612.1 ATP-grasp domain-containing protein [Nocardia sp. CDC159]